MKPMKNIQKTIHVTGDIPFFTERNTSPVNNTMIKKGVHIIDVGINRIRDNSKKKGYRIVGDVDYNSVIEFVSSITPVPGGVGPMTISMLLKNTVQAAEKSIK